MKHAIGWAVHALCLAAVLLAIWTPFGSWWQWAATAVVLLLVGAVLLGSTSGDRYAELEEIPLREGEVLRGTGDEELDHTLNTRPKYGKRTE